MSSHGFSSKSVSETSSSTSKPGKRGILGLPELSSQLMGSIQGENDGFSNTLLFNFTLIFVIAVIYLSTYSSKIGIANSVLSNMKWGAELKNIKTGEAIIGSDGKAEVNPDSNTGYITMFGSTGQMLFAILNVTWFTLGGAAAVNNLIKYTFPKLHSNTTARTIISISPALIQLLLIIVAAIIAASSPGKIGFYFVGYGVVASFLSALGLCGIWLNFYKCRKLGIAVRLWENIISSLFNLFFIVYGCMTIYFYLSTPKDIIDYMIRYMSLYATRDYSGLIIAAQEKTKDLA